MLGTVTYIVKLSTLPFGTILIGLKKCHFLNNRNW